MERKKKHADFQDEYRKSSNFSKLNENEADELKIKGNGEVKLKKDTEINTKSEKQSIKKTLKEIGTEEE